MTIDLSTLQTEAEAYVRQASEITRKALYVKKNLFSSESIYFFIHSFITALIFSMSIGLICPLSIWPSVVIGAASGTVLLVILAAKYFSECIRVYQVIIGGLDKSFNQTFSKAWFLHFYL